MQFSTLGWPGHVHLSILSMWMVAKAMGLKELRGERRVDQKRNAYSHVGGLKKRTAGKAEQEWGLAQWLSD